MLYKSLLNAILLYGCQTWTLLADPGSESPTWNTRPTTVCGARSTSLWVHRNRFWQLSRDGNLHGSGMSHATTASPKPSSRTPWSVGEGNVGWTTSKSGHPCPCQNYSQGPPAEKTGRGSLVNRSSCPPIPPSSSPTTRSVNGLNGTETA